MNCRGVSKKYSEGATTPAGSQRTKKGVGKSDGQMKREDILGNV